MDIHEKVPMLADGFSSCAKMLTAIGDETRQHLILEMMKMSDCSGVRVCEITEKTNLSRPAVSHHLQIMKDAGIVKVRKEGTKNYYYFDPEMEAFEKLVSTLHILGNDAAYLPESFSEYKIPGFIVNKELAEKSLAWLIKCKSDPFCKGVFVNHDPTIQEQRLEVNL